MRVLLVTIQLAGLFVLAYCTFLFLQGRAYQEYEQRTFSKDLQERQLANLPSSLPLSVAPFQSRLAAPNPHSNIGRIEIPRLQLSTMILEGDGTRELQLGAGHVPGTAMPGKVGNVVIAAHRDTFFRPLQNIALNDKIKLTTLGGSYQYVVDSVKLVNPTDTQVLGASAGSSLTLVTCYPFYYVGSAPKRFIVHAKKVG